MIRTSEFLAPFGSVAVAERGGRVLAVTLGQLSELEELLAARGDLGEMVRVDSHSGLEVVRGFLGGQEAQPSQLDFSLVKSEFDHRVLRELLRVPRGSSVTYGELASRVGSPGGARAVGGSMRRNPLPLVVPCHRVLPASGHVGHYSGGGPRVKTWLLDHEGVSHS